MEQHEFTAQLGQQVVVEFTTEEGGTDTRQGRLNRIGKGGPSISSAYPTIDIEVEWEHVVSVTPLEGVTA